MSGFKSRTSQIISCIIQACNFLGLKHILHSSLEKSLIERVMQYFKDRTESFDDYYHCIK
ncbi:MAG: hypothetical protein ACPKPY_13255 [Nitrososphaeraceae archaeon]